MGKNEINFKGYFICYKVNFVTFKQINEKLIMISLHFYRRSHQITWANFGKVRIERQSVIS